MTTWRQASLLGYTLAAILTVSSTGSPICLSCSYTRTSDPTFTWECVSDPYHNDRTANMTCDFTTHLCYIKVSYELGGFETVRSLMRACELKSWPGFALLSNGCSKEDQYQSCIYKCQSDLCNDGDGDLYKTRYQFTTPTPYSAGSALIVPVILSWTLAASLALYGS